MTSEKDMYKSRFLLFLILLTIPQTTGGPICYGSCVAAVVTAGLVGSSAILSALSSAPVGVAVVPTGSLFAMLQSAVAIRVSWDGLENVYNACADLCAPKP